MRRAFVIVAVAALWWSGCNNAPLPTAPTTSTRNTTSFNGTLQPSGSQRLVLFVRETGTVDLTLYSVRPAGAVVPALSVPMRIGFGLPIGDGCTFQAASTFSPGLTTQVSVTTLGGTFCVGIEDEGRLTQAVDFNMRVVHP